MKYYSEETVKKIMEKVEVKYIQESQFDDNVYTIRRIYPKLADYPSIEIPKEHGDLKDTDAIRKEIGKFFCEKCKNEDDDKCWDCPANICIRLIDEAPTILEASK